MFMIMFSQKSWSPAVDWYLGNKGGGEFRAAIKLEKNKHICGRTDVLAPSCHTLGTVSNGRLAS